MSSTVTPETGRRYSRAAAFLIHWQGGAGTDGALEILREVESGFRDIAGDPAALAGFVCALASLAWEMAAQPDPEAAMEYLRDFTAAAYIEVPAGAGGEQG